MDYVVGCARICETNGKNEMVIPLLVRSRYFLRHRAIMRLGFVTEENRLGCHFPILKIYNLLEADGDDVR